MTVNSIIRDDILIYQPKKGFRFGSDSVILTWFTTIKNNDKVLDIGSGSGIISILAALKKDVRYITSVELQTKMYECLIKTVENNNLCDIIKPVNCDIKTFSCEDKFDLIISNPPYRPTNTGRQCLFIDENLARFNSCLDVDSLMLSASKLIKFGGRFSFCGDSDRLAEVMYSLQKHSFQPKRLLFLYSDSNSRSKLFFMESTYKGGVELVVMPPLVQNSSFYNEIFKGEWLNR